MKKRKWGKTLKVPSWQAGRPQSADRDSRVDMCESLNIINIVSSKCRYITDNYIQGWFAWHVKHILRKNIFLHSRIRKFYWLATQRGRGTRAREGINSAAAGGEQFAFRR